MKIKSILLIIDTLIFLTACATLPIQEKPIERGRNFNRPFREVWNKTVEGLARSGKAISYTDKASGLITVEEKIAGDDVSKLALNPGFLTTYYGGKSKASIYIKAISQHRTRVFVNTEISAVGTPLISNKPQEVIRLKSNGTIEKNYLDLIGNLLKQACSPTSPQEIPIEMLKPTSMVVVKPSANVRENPTIHSNIIATLQQGTAVTMTGRKGSWAMVKLPGGEKGWIYAGLIRPKFSPNNVHLNNIYQRPARQRPATAIVTATKECEIKKGPGPFYPVLKTVPQGTRLKKTGKEKENWIEVEVGNEKGYVYKNFVK